MFDNRFTINYQKKKKKRNKTKTIGTFMFEIHLSLENILTINLHNNQRIGRYSLKILAKKVRDKGSRNVECLIKFVYKFDQFKTCFIHRICGIIINYFWGKTIIPSE